MKTARFSCLFLFLSHLLFSQAVVTNSQVQTVANTAASTAATMNSKINVIPTLNADYMLLPAMVFETEAIAIATANVALASGSAYQRRIIPGKSGTVTQLGFRVVTAGGVLTIGTVNNSIAIYDQTGNRLGIADCNSAFLSTGDKLVTLDTPVTIVAGSTYWISVISTGTITPVLQGALGTRLINFNQSAPPYNYQQLTTGGNALMAILTGTNITSASGNGRVWIMGL